MLSPLPNQHGVAISPTNPELINKVGVLLRSQGGERFVTPDVFYDALTERLVTDGKEWDQTVLQAPGAEHCACHEVSASIHGVNPSRFIHVYGYALSEDDQMWRTHSWVYDRQADRVLEPTPTPRGRYFGVALTDDESERWFS